MRTTIDTAVVMAGGEGMRLRPYTMILPKPLMPLGDRPLLEVLVCQLRNAGIRRVIVSVNHLAHLIRSVLDNVAPEGMLIDYQYESSPLGTCGALALMRDRLPESVLVVNGDLLSDYPMANLIRRHTESNAALSIGTLMSRRSVNCGVIRRDADGRMCEYVERPSTEHELSIGLYAVERDTIETFLHTGDRMDMPDLIRTLLAEGYDVEAVPADCEWIDIGIPQDYQRAQELFEQHGDRFLGANRQ